MEVNDTLKFRTYGWKKDIDQKRDKIDRLYREHKQYYPNDAHGNLDEWHALIKYQADNYKQDMMLAKQHALTVKEQYKLDLDRQIKEKQYNNDIDSAKKQGERDFTNNNIGLANQLSQQARNDDQGLKNYLHDQYLRGIEDNKRKQDEAKQRDLMEDNNMLDRDRLNDRNSQRAQKERNLKYKKDLDDVADYHNYLKKQLAKKEKDKEDEDYLLGCQRENEKRDKEKDDWYKKYKKISDDMDKRLKDTVAQARPTMDRDMMRQKKIDDDADKYGDKMFRDKEKEQEKMREQWKDAYNQNHRNLQDKSRAAQLGKLKDKEDNDFKQRELMAFNQGEEENKRKQEEQRHLYKEVLQNQMTLNALGRYNYGNMTHEEKNLNKADLRGYKDGDMRTMHCLVPGIKNLDSVGSKPLMRGAMNVMDFSDSPPHGTKGRKGQMFFSPGHRQPQGLGYSGNFQNPLPHQSHTISRNTTIRKPATPRGSFGGQSMDKTDFERYKAANMSMPGGSRTSRNAPSTMSMYNPIVNPVDTTVHNQQVLNQVPNYYKTNHY